MTHNDLLRRLRYALDLNDTRVLALLRLGEVELAPADLATYLARDDDPAQAPCPDRVMAGFLDGLVLDRRGPRDPGAGAGPPRDAGMLDNNQILKKLRVAFELQESDMLAVLKKGDMEVSPSELGALFRKPDHKHFKRCGDQLLRNFVKGLTVHLRPAA